MIQRWLFGCCVLLAAGLLRADEPRTLHGFADVKRLIEDNDADTLDKFVKALPEEFRRQYVLMTSTQSAHQATKLRPRVIMMGNGCRLILAFSGALTDPNYEALEAIEFDEQKAVFVFREIRFDRRHRNPPHISEANPSRCLDCHGASPRPNWEPAMGWEGAIGETPQPTAEDLRQLGIYMYRKDVRYRGLLAKENRKLTQDSKQTFARVMADNLNVLNAKRIARRLYDSPDYQTYKFALAAALLDAPRFLNFVPFDEQAGRTEAGYRNLLTEVHCDVTQNIPALKLGWETSSGGFRIADARVMANLRYVLETRGVELSDFAMSAASPYFLTATGVFSGKAILRELYRLDDKLAQVQPLPANFEKLMFESGDSSVPLADFAKALEAHNKQAMQAAGLELPTGDLTLTTELEPGDCTKAKPGKPLPQKVGAKSEQPSG